MALLFCILFDGISAPIYSDIKAKYKYNFRMYFVYIRKLYLQY